jgi:hypothetical protein
MHLGASVARQPFRLQGAAFAALPRALKTIPGAVSGFPVAAAVKPTSHATI